MILDLHPEIAEAQASLKAAEAFLKMVIDKVQVGCRHRVVYETPYQREEYCAGHPALRICACCRFEEEAKGYSEDYSILSGENLDTTGRVFVKIDRDKLYELRIRP